MQQIDKGFVSKTWVLCVMLGWGCGGDDKDATKSLYAGQYCTEVSSGELYLGLVGGYTGAYPVAGDHERAVSMAVEDANAAGGINGKTVGLVACETGGDPATAVAAVNEISDAFAGKLSGIVGPFRTAEVESGVASAIAQKKVLSISAAASGPSLRTIDDGGYFFRTIGNDATSNSKTGAHIAHELRAYRKMMVVWEKDPYQQGLCDTYAEYLDDYGDVTIETLEVDPASSGTWQTTALDSINSFGPDGVFACFWANSGGTFFKAAAAYTWTGTSPRFQLGGTLANAGFISSVDNHAFTAGMHGTVFGVELTDDFVAFQSHWTAKFGGEAPKHAERGYDAAALIMLAAMQSSDPGSGMAVRDAITKTQPAAGAVEVRYKQWTEAIAAINAGKTVDYTGASGTVDFDSYGDILEVINQEFHINANGELVFCGCWRTTDPPSACEPQNGVSCADFYD